MKNKGFGVIELMVCIIIASIVTVGLYSVLTSSVISFGISKADNAAVSTSHRVNVTLNNFLFQAGFVNYRRELQYFEWTGEPAQLSIDGVAFNNPQWTNDTIVIGGTSSGNHGDAIKFRFTGSSIADDVQSNYDSSSIDEAQANGYIFDCYGRAVSSNVILEMALYVTDEGLMCRHAALHNEDTYPINYGNEAPVLIDPSVKVLRLQYSAFNDTASTSFTNYNSISDKSIIDTVRYSYVTSQPTQQQLLKTKQLVNLQLFPEDDSVTYAVPEAERANIHRVITGTVALLNASLAEAD